MKRIAVIPGDGTGPEVVREGRKVLEAAAKKYAFPLSFTEFDFGGARYLRTGETLPDGAIDELRKFDAIYLGAIGHPDVKPGILEQGILLRLRFELDQYINLRPVKLYPNVETPLANKKPEDIDFVIVRENVEGLYIGAGGFMKKGTPDEVAIQEMVYTRKGVERCVRFAFEVARKRNRRKKLTLCGKTNVLTYCQDLWWRTFQEVAKDYPDVTTDYAHVDATTMWIITDLGAMVQGGMGVAAGGNINPNGVSMFEPIGGSAPKYTGQGVINPVAAILAGAMMLDQLGAPQAAAAVEKSTVAVIAKMKSVAAGKMGFSTSEVGDMVARGI
jgi:3-isopropylmalate dehydrogenase